MHLKPYTLVAAALAVPMLYGSLADAGSSQRRCNYTILSERPGWSGSGFWNNGELVLIDTVNRCLVRTSQPGRTGGAELSLLSQALRNVYPSKVESNGSKVVIQAAGSRFLSLDQHLALESGLDTSSRPDRFGATIDKVLDWALAGNDIVGFAEVKSPGNRWSTGIARFSLNQPSDFQMQKPVPKDGPTRQFHKFNFHYIASVGNAGYVVLMEDGMRLYRSLEDGSFEEVSHLAKNGQYVNALGVIPVPDLPRFVVPEDLADTMQAVERSEMPVGIYGWHENLFLLSRRPNKGRTDWTLSRIDLEQGRIGAAALLPSHAHHLFAVPGSDQWAFVEKGPAYTMHSQDVTGVFFVPSERVEKLSSGLLCP